MLEFLINPKKAEKKPWEMFFVGLVYATISVLIPFYFFGSDYVTSKYLSWISIMFLVILTMPYIYYAIKLEERKEKVYDGGGKLLREHGKTLMTFLWLFLGFVIAFSLLYIILPHGENLFKAQVEAYCQMNRGADFQSCLKQYGVSSNTITGATATSFARVLSIFSNNVKVLILTLFFSLLLGAGAIFVLAWNASVIAAAIKIFTNSDISHIGSALGRYMIHGLPEIAAYFVGALAGGILSIAIIRKEMRSDKFWTILQDVIILILIAFVILFISALIEVFITPKLF